MDNRLYMQNYRHIVMGVDAKVPLAGGQMVDCINFDNAATTPPFVTVMEEILKFSPWYSSVHRGTGYKSRLSSNVFEKSRNTVLKFVNGDPERHTVIYVKNTTEALNKLSYRLCDGVKKCVVLSTGMEHHSNDLPWRSKFKVDYISVDKYGRLSLEDLENWLIKYKGDVKLVTLAGASNVTGYINPIHEAAYLAHKYGAKVCVDGAQLIPHVPFNMMPENHMEHIDYLAFSAHKMYAPFGIGVLIGPKEDFDRGEPDYVGGGTVKIVTPSLVKWDNPPHKEEAGSPNIMGIVALLASIKTLNMIGMDNIEKYERDLLGYALYRLKSLDGVKLYGEAENDEKRVGIIPLNVDGIHHSITAEILSGEAGIAVRNGCFCAQPYIQKLLDIEPEQLKAYIDKPDAPRPGMVRVSFGLYNNFKEIDTLVDVLKWICENRDAYNGKYRGIQSYQIQ